MVAAAPLKSLIGLTLLLAGIPVYFIWSGRGGRPS
jgi:hypothetical protein